MDAEDPSTLCPDYDHVTWIWKTEKISSIASKLKNFDSILNKVLTMEKFFLDDTRKKELLPNRMEYQQ